MALTLAQMEARFPGGPSTAYRAAAEEAPRRVPGELGAALALVMQAHADARDAECRSRRLNTRSWLVSAGIPNALASVLLDTGGDL